MEVTKNDKGGYTYIFNKEDLLHYGMPEHVIHFLKASPMSAQILMPKFIEILKKVDEEYGTCFCGDYENNKEVAILFRLLPNYGVEIRTEIDNFESKFEENQIEENILNHNNPFEELLNNIKKEEENKLKKQNNKKNKDDYKILVFESFSKLLDACKIYYNINYDRESIVYKYKENYYLYLPKTTPKDEYLFIEFFTEEISNISIECIIEHGTKLSNQNAIKEFSKI